MSDDTDDARDVAALLRTERPNRGLCDMASNTIEGQADEIDRLRATIAALLAVPDDSPATDLMPVSWLKRRMAAVVGGGS